MSQDPAQPVLDVVELDAGVADAIRELPHADRWCWRTWPGLDAFIAHLDRDETQQRLNLFVAADHPEDLDVARLRELQSRARRVDVVVVVREFDESDPKRLIRQGIANIERLPLPPFPPEVLLRERRHLASLFPGELYGLRRETLEFDLPARREAVPPLVRTLCERCDLFGHPHEFVRSHLPLVVDEAVTNAMQHGSGWDPLRSVRVVAVLAPDRVELVVQDDGPGFFRDDVADPLAGENRRRSGGRGLFLMESLMDTVEYRDGGRTVVLLKHLPTHETAGVRVAG